MDAQDGMLLAILAGVVLIFISLFIIIDPWGKDFVPVLMLTVPLLIGCIVITFHLGSWIDRENNFTNRYGATEIIHLGDKTAVWIDAKDRLCNARVTYLRGDPGGELFIVKGTRHCDKGMEVEDN